VGGAQAVGRARRRDAAVRHEDGAAAVVARGFGQRHGEGVRREGERLAEDQAGVGQRDLPLPPRLGHAREW
jgi:hypothetical protein